MSRIPTRQLVPAAKRQLPVPIHSMRREGGVFVVLDERKLLHLLDDNLDTVFEHQLPRNTVAATVDPSQSFIAVANDKGVIRVHDRQGRILCEFPSARLPNDMERAAVSFDAAKPILCVVSFADNHDIVTAISTQTWNPVSSDSIEAWDCMYELLPRSTRSSRLAPSLSMNLTRPHSPSLIQRPTTLED